jgi:RNA polymerase sigma-70 factor (ECF subfamily)
MTLPVHPLSTSGSEPPAPDSPDDVMGLVTRVQAGDVDAFEPLYRAHADRIYALCLRMSGDPTTAQELTQDVFVRCWERIGSFRGDSRFGTWLHRVAVNVVLEHTRTRNRREARVEPTDDPDLLGGGGKERHDDTRMDLEQAVGQLPPKARTVFILHDIEGYRHREIAEMTGSAPGTLRAQLHRARQLLMEALS